MYRKYAPSEQDITLIEALIEKLRRVIRGDESVRSLNVTVNRDYEENPYGPPLFVDEDITVSISQFLGVKCRKLDEKGTN